MRAELPAHPFKFITGFILEDVTLKIERERTDGKAECSIRLDSIH